jgi:hypothetical protein
MNMGQSQPVLKALRNGFDRQRAGTILRFVVIRTNPSIVAQASPTP